MLAEIEKFIAELRKSLEMSTFVKLTLSNYKGGEEQLQRISVRKIETKKGTRLAFQARYSTREVVKNFEIVLAVEKVGTFLEKEFQSAHLFTTDNDFQLTIGKKRARIVTGRPSLKSKPSASHDREKKYLVDPSAYYLKALGVTTDGGEIRSDQRDKWRQINKFVEIVNRLIANSSLHDKNDLRIVDMGSGKGYLTFALYDHLVRTESGSDRIPSTQGLAATTGLRDGIPKRNATVMERAAPSLSITGVEHRKELVAVCNDIAQVSGFDGLKFVQGSIADFEPGEVDILIALHACDTATDDALYKGIRSNASIIVAAPCCHHELKAQLQPPDLLAGILKHPVLLERTAETITDGIRSILLEATGYKTKMFEFVAAEHTPKNNMLVATRVGSPRVRSPRVSKDCTAGIMSEFGIRNQRLLDLLNQRYENKNDQS